MVQLNKEIIVKVMERIYFAIDLKSFYASVECVERGLDPLKTNLLVADESRTDKTICLAVSPALKEYGLSSRARLFEAKELIRKANADRRKNAPNKKFTGVSFDDDKLKKDKSLEIGYITAVPRMALYSKYSAKIYGIYLKYFSKEDIHDYSIDEVFIDATDYVKATKLSPEELVRKVIKDVLNETGITATAGIGTNLYLCKVAMDIVAKRVKPDKYGVRVAYLDEKSYRKELWSHTPITDFWRVGKGYATKLAHYGIYTMGDIARCSLGKPNQVWNEDLLYKLFGINAELLIDHAWGWEPCLMKDVKAYKPSTNSISAGQVLHCAYKAEDARLITREMVDALVLDLVEKGYLTNQIVLTVSYDIDNLTNPVISKNYKGEITVDYYGRKAPKHAHGTTNLEKYTSSTKMITQKTLELFDKIVNFDLFVRRINISACKLLKEEDVKKEQGAMQLSFFDDYEKEKRDIEMEQKERNVQKAVINIKKKFGKNAILKGMNLQEGATARDRNEQIGGHKA